MHKMKFATTTAATANAETSLDIRHNIEMIEHCHSHQQQHQQQQKNRKQVRHHHRATKISQTIKSNMLLTAVNCNNFDIRSGSSLSTNKSHTSQIRTNVYNMWSTTAVFLLGILYFLSTCDQSLAALRNVNLFIEPPAVRRSQSVTLRCQYTLEGAPLYSVKFYRGNFEFFRYTPGEYPNTKVFPYPGIKVDESMSNATQVIIRNVDFGQSGNFSCEVTADAPLFSTATAYAHMQVVEFPEKRPQLFTELTRYEPGDILRANCSTPPSRPRAELKFTLNNIPVSSEETQYIRTVDNLIASRLSLKLQLQGVHFAAGSNSHMMNAFAGSTLGGNGGIMGVPYNTLNVHGSTITQQQGHLGGLLLRCTATIGDLYQEYKEIELGTPQKDPVPARVTLSSSSSLRNFFESYFSSAASTATSTWRTSSLRPSGRFATNLQIQVLNLGLATGAVVAFHWLQLCSCR